MKCLTPECNSTFLLYLGGGGFKKKLAGLILSKAGLIGEAFYTYPDYI